MQCLQCQSARVDVIVRMLLYRRIAVSLLASLAVIAMPPCTRPEIWFVTVLWISIRICISRLTAIRSALRRTFCKIRVGHKPLSMCQGPLANSTAVAFVGHLFECSNCQWRFSGNGIVVQSCIQSHTRFPIGKLWFLDIRTHNSPARGSSNWAVPTSYDFWTPSRFPQYPVLMPGTDSK